MVCSAPGLRRLLSPVALLTVLAAGSVAQTVPSYQATFLGNGSHVAAMNDAGTVAYRGSISIYPRAFVSTAGQPGVLLPVPPGFLSSSPSDINEAGVVVGNISPYQTTAFSAQPARWDPDGTGGYTVTLLPNLPGDDRGTADALDDVGDILGTSSYLATKHTVLHTDGGAVELPGLGALSPVAVNNQRVYITVDGSRVHLGTLQVEPLPVPAGSDAVSSHAINALGQVAGSLQQAGCGSVAAVFTPGLGWQTIGVCGAGNRCFDLNDSGDVLLVQGGAPYVQFAGGGLHRVEDLIVDDGGHWTVTSVAGIALDGQQRIAVAASHSTSGQSGIILLDPEPGVVCQADLGSGGPGSVTLGMCGGDLSSGTTADLHLDGGVPGGLAGMFLGLVQGAAPFAGGTLVPVPWNTVRLLPLDASGNWQVLGVPGGIGPLSVYLQAVVPDAAQPLGYALSNALRADFLP